MHQHGPHQPEPGRRNHRAGRLLALILLAAIALPFAAACSRGGGKDDDSNGPDARNGGAGAIVTATAEELVPDLTPLGYELVDEFSQPIQIPGQDNFRRAFVRKGSSNRVALVDVTVHATLETAEQAYALAAEQWANPPPGVFSGIERFEETPSPDLGDEQRSYVSSNADDAGNRAWTDVYRARNVVIVVQVLDRGDTDQLDLRTQLADTVVAALD